MHIRTTHFVKIAFIFFASTAFVHAQEITLNVKSFDPCNSTYAPELLMSLVKDGKTFEVADTLGTFFLPEVGKYKMIFFDQTFYRLIDSITYIQVKLGANFDTLIYNTVRKCVVRDLHKGGGCGYLCCNNLCDGHYIDYFDNGGKKIEGSFRNGIPIGKLIFYLPNGRKKRIDYYDHAGNGRLLKQRLFQ